MTLSIFVSLQLQQEKNKYKNQNSRLKSELNFKYKHSFKQREWHNWVSASTATQNVCAFSCLPSYRMECVWPAWLECYFAFTNSLTMARKGNLEQAHDCTIVVPPQEMKKQKVTARLGIQFWTSCFTFWRSNSMTN